jgi:hypothetical protein
VHDHIIVGKEGHASFKGLKLIYYVGFQASVSAFLPSGADLRNEDVFAQRLCRSQDCSAHIDDGGRAE